MSGSGSSTESRRIPAAGRDERVLVLAMGISTAGSVLNAIALLTHVFAVTSASTPVGLAVLVSFLPVVVCQPLLARWLQRVAPRSTAVAMALVQAAVAGTMAVSSRAFDSPVLLYVCAGVLGVCAMSLRLTMLSSLPRVVDAERLTAANVSIQVASQVGAVAGAAALALAGGAPPWVLFLVDAVTFVAQAALLTVCLPVRAPAPTTSADPGAPANPAGPTRLLGHFLLVPAGFITLNAVNVAMPLIALGTLDAGQRGFALAETVYPVAAVGAGVAMRRVRRLPIMWCVALIATGWLILAGTTHLTALLVGVGVLGVAVVTSNASTQAWLQSSVPPAAQLTLQSRVAACGAAVSAVLVLGLSGAYDAGLGRPALVAIGVAFALLAASAGRLLAPVGHDGTTASTHDRQESPG